MIPATYNFSDHKRGDTFEGVDFTILLNNEPVNLTGAVIKAQLKKTSISNVAAQWSTEDGSITITGAGNNVVRLQTKVIDIPAGVYSFEIQTNNNGLIQTWVAGLFPVLNDITR